MKKHLHAMISCICLCHTICCYAFSPRQGDLFFQDLNCGSLCNAITNVTQGYGHTQVSHVGMFVKFHGHADIIEAIGTKVQLTPLKTFLQRSIDTQGKPRVMVGRLKMQYQKLIPNAVDAALSWQGLPYNASFTPDNHMRKFYCSQLVADAFQSSNHSVTFFKINRMNFEKNGHILPASPNGATRTTRHQPWHDVSVRQVDYYLPLRAIATDKKSPTIAGLLVLNTNLDSETHRSTKCIRFRCFRR